MAKTKLRRKHVPQRTCVGCRQVIEKRTLMRIVRLPGSIQVDPSGKLTGRGAYLHNRRSCWEIGLKGALEKALKTEFTDIDREYLLNIMATLPEEAPTREVEHDE